MFGWEAYGLGYVLDGQSNEVGSVLISPRQSKLVGARQIGGGKEIM